MSATDVIKFWFDDIEPKQRFIKDPEFDELIRSNFAETHSLATQGLLYSWRDHPLDALAEIIVLDQFSRNMFRDTPAAFASDTLALVLAQEAIRKKFDKELDSSKRSFLYMPFMHSESKEIHDVAMFLFDQPGLEDNYNFEVKHKAIIDRFGRYPHRNEILGRESTSEELEFLSQPGSSF
ncbi:MAG: membrane protein [Pseudohongiella sp.]|nr:MAG: membrane protein [Pseudohongiella sp.]